MDPNAEKRPKPKNSIFWDENDIEDFLRNS